MVQIGKSALAAGLAWEAAARLLHGPSPFYAPLAALLTVYSTVFRSVVAATQRVAGVVLGVLLAYLLAQLLPLTGFTVALVVFLSLALSRWHRLGDQSSQVPVTALLLLLLGRADPSQYALARLAETALGAGVGVGVNLLIAPPTHIRAASDAVQAVADSIADLLADLAESLATWPPDGPDRWLRRARALPQQITAARNTLAKGRDSQRLNPRTALRSRRSLTELDTRLDNLEHIAVLTRTSVRMLSDAASDDDGTALNGAFLRPYRHLVRCAGQAVAQYPDDRHSAAEQQADSWPCGSVADAQHQLRSLARQITSVAARPREMLTYTSLLAELDRLLAHLSPRQRPG